MPTTDMEKTLAALRVRPWKLVSLGLRSKKPTGETWQIVTDPAVVMAHQGNLGLQTHQETGVAVLDPDKILEWADMIDTLGQPGKAWVETGSGRLHYYVAWEPDLPAKLVWNHQIIGEIQRGPGQQQVVIPPSQHPDNGRRYRWLVDPATEPLVRLPEEWRTYFRSLSAPVPPPSEKAVDALDAALHQPGAKRRHGMVKFQCPACAAEGHDRHRDNAAYFTATGTWGCAWAKDTTLGRTHWDAIGTALGVMHRQEVSVPPFIPPMSPDLAPPLTVPDAGVIGLGREFADLFSQYLESPRAFFYFTFLTYFGALIARKVTLDSELRPQPRLYTILVGESADTRKTTALAKTDAFFRSLGPEWTPAVLLGVGSAEGIAAELKDTPDLILHFDELKAFVDKAKNEHSIALPMVSTLFERADYDNRVKTEKISVRDAALSLVAGCTADTYATIFDHKFLAIGFPNRLFLVADRSSTRIALPTMIPEAALEPLRVRVRTVLEEIETAYQAHGRRPVPYRLTSGALDRFRAWYAQREGSIFERRLDTYGHRLLVLLAATTGRSVIDEDLTERVLALLRYQLDLRRELDPVDADNAVAAMEERIRRGLARGALKSRDLKRKVHYDRAGIWIWNTAVENLKGAREVAHDPKRDLFWLREPVTTSVTSTKNEGSANADE